MYRMDVESDKNNYQCKGVRKEDLYVDYRRMIIIDIDQYFQ